MKRALITGITGQDGSYLTELLLEKGYEVHGIIRRASSFNTGRIDHLYRDPHLDGVRLFLHYGDLTDSSNLSRLIEKIQPSEIYNLGAQSHVQVSFEVPEYTAETDAIGTLRLLDAIKETGVPARFYQASTSELYGKVQEIPQSETTPFYPRSPYAVAKQYGFWITKNYREAYNLHASNGILFNHESPRRGETFVTRKITMAVARIHRGLQECFYMGNIDACRDWGYAPDYVRTMWLMLQQEKPGDYVLSTALIRSIQTGDLRIVGIISNLGRDLSEGEIKQLETAEESILDENCYLQVIKKKTATLLSACTEIGAISSGASAEVIALCREFGEYLGYCFQIKDDIFDYFKEANIGKPTGNDIREGKVTLPLLYALRQGREEEAARYLDMILRKDFAAENVDSLIEFAKANGGIEYAEARMKEYHDKAVDVLLRLPESEARISLIQLADYIMTRSK